MATSIHKISSGVYGIEQGMVRCFLILGNTRAILLDTGAEPCDMMALIRTVTKLPVLVLHTHGDGDHTANDGQFTDIYAHPKEFPIIRQFRPELKAHLHPITGSSAFDLGERILQVVETPGHTPGSISLLDRRRRILFSGDTVSYGPVFLFGAHRDVSTYRKTLTMLMDLGGFDTVYPCHNTCPVSLTVLPALMGVVDGALDGTIAPTSPDMPLPEGLEAKCYSFGKCSILL